MCSSRTVRQVVALLRSASPNSVTSGYQHLAPLRRNPQPSPGSASGPLLIAKAASHAPLVSNFAHEAVISVWGRVERSRN